MTFARTIPTPEQRQAEKDARRAVLCTPSRSLHRGSYAGSTSGEVIEKDAPVRSEAYRRIVADLACAFCGVVGYSQAAHAEENKGLGIKSDDRTCVPLCCDRPGVRGCHSKMGQGALLTKEKRRIFERAAAEDTREVIDAAGMWPANLPRWEE